MKKRVEKCHECGGTRFRIEAKTSTWSFQNRKINVRNIPSRVCARCDAVTFDLAVLQSCERGVVDAIARSGPINGETFAFMRKVLGMKSGDLAATLGVAPETVSRWENDKTPVDKAAWLAVGTMALEAVTPLGKRVPDLRDRLEQLARPPRKKTLDLELQL